MMAQLRKERDQLKLMVSQMAADKESLAVSLEGHIDQRIDRVLTLEDKNTRYVYQNSSCSLVPKRTVR